jgi:hypothetical protein
MSQQTRKIFKEFETEQKKKGVLFPQQPSERKASY